MNIFRSKILTKILPFLTARYTMLCPRWLQPPRDDCAVRGQWFSSVYIQQKIRLPLIFLLRILCSYLVYKIWSYNVTTCMFSFNLMYIGNAKISNQRPEIHTLRVKSMPKWPFCAIGTRLNTVCILTDEASIVEDEKLITWSDNTNSQSSEIHQT